VSPSYAEGTITLSKSKIKLSYLVNFARYVRWPTNAFNSSGSPVVIAIDIEHPYSETLDNKKVGITKEGRDIVFKSCSTPPESKDVHIIYIQEGASTFVGIDAKQFGGSTLTVGDAQDFIHSGGVIQLMDRGKNIAFSINQKMAQKLGLNIHYKILKMAQPLVGTDT